VLDANKFTIKAFKPAQAIAPKPWNGKWKEPFSDLTGSNG
jgi:hypothetical protein